MVERDPFEHLTAVYKDVLKELGNIGAGNAMTALSSMLQRRIDMEVPQVMLLDFRDVGSLIGGEEQVMLGVFSDIKGDMNGCMLFLTDNESSEKITCKLLNDLHLSEEEAKQMEYSAMQEIGNIVCSAYANALALMTGMKILTSPPDLIVDMAGAILSVPAIQQGIISDKLLLIETKFGESMEGSGFFLMIPDAASYEKMFAALGFDVSMT